MVWSKRRSDSSFEEQKDKEDNASPGRDLERRQNQNKIGGSSSGKEGLRQRISKCFWIPEVGGLLSSGFENQGARGAPAPSKDWVS